MKISSHPQFLLRLLILLCVTSNPVFATAQADQAAQDEAETRQLSAYLERSQALLREWYPKVNALLYGETHPLPFDDIHISIESGFESRYQGVIAYVDGANIHVAANMVVNMPDSFEAMMIHELTHINQHYPRMDKQSIWVSEGIADYIRHKYFEKDIAPSLRLNANAQLYGYERDEPYFFSLQEQKTSLQKKGYLLKYTVASSFLYWLEVSKDKDIVRKLNLALSQDEYTPSLFKQHCGATLDKLWQEFILTSQNRQASAAAY